MVWHSEQEMKINSQHTSEGSRCLFQQPPYSRKCHVSSPHMFQCIFKWLCRVGNFHGFLQKNVLRLIPWNFSSFKTLHQFRGRAAVASLSLLTSPSSDECVDDLQLWSVGLWHVVVHNLSQHRADKHWIWGGSALWCCVVFFHPQGRILRERWGCKHSCCLQELFTSGCFTDRFIHGQIYTDAFRKVVVMHVQFAKTNRQTPSTYLYMKPNL